MAIGTPPNALGINQALTGMAIALRNQADAILQQQAYLNNLGTSGLQAIGFTATDAQAVLDAINHMATVAQVYRGTATQATLFNFENSLLQLWGGG